MFNGIIVSKGRHILRIYFKVVWFFFVLMTMFAKKMVISQLQEFSIVYFQSSIFNGKVY